MRSIRRKPAAGDIVSNSSMQDDLATLQRETFDYFIHQANPANGLISIRPSRTGPQASPPPALRWPAIP